MLVGYVFLIRPSTETGSKSQCRTCKKCDFLLSREKREREKEKERREREREKERKRGRGRERCLIALKGRFFAIILDMWSFYGIFIDQFFDWPI